MQEYLVPYSISFSEIVYNKYGNLNNFEYLLSINPHILDSLIVEAGIIVYLEVFEVETTATTEENVRALW